MTSGPPVRAFLGLGSNLGDQQRLLADGLAFLADQIGRDQIGRDQVGRDQVGRDQVGREQVGLVAVSSLYRSEPIDAPTGSAAFLNLVVELRVAQTPYELLAICQQAEQKAERVRYEINGPRTLDVDVLLYGDMHLTDPDLTIPHPRMLERRFVMDPLAELAPELAMRLLDELDPQKRAATDAVCLGQDCHSIGSLERLPVGQAT